MVVSIGLYMRQLRKIKINLTRKDCRIISQSSRWKSRSALVGFKPSWFGLVWNPPLDTTAYDGGGTIALLAEELDWFFDEWLRVLVESGTTIARHSVGVLIWAFNLIRWDRRGLVGMAGFLPEWFGFTWFLTRTCFFSSSLFSIQLLFQWDELGLIAYCY